MDKKEILDFLKDNQQLFQDRPENLDWTKIYDLASTRFKYDDMGKFTEFWLNRKVHPENYLKELPDWFLFRSTIKEFTIPKNIARIGNSAFEGCASLTNIEIPANVTRICAYSFRACLRLKSVTIPNSIMSIGYAAFDNCGGNLTIDYQGTKEQWKKIYDAESFLKTYFTVICTDGRIVKKKR